MDNSVHIYFETQNLLVRQYKPEDVDELFRLMSDVRVHQYTKDKNHPWDRLRTERYIQFFIEKNFMTLDCFHGAVIEKASNKMIGLAGLNLYKENETEIEWKLGVDYWNKGYATEIGRAILSESFKTTTIAGIYGMADRENTASRRVLEKIGMEYLGIHEFRNKNYAFYHVKRA